eukprot:scaffold207776_cov32-Tisochrysis_lutea.AAC.4
MKRKAKSMSREKGAKAMGGIGGGGMGGYSAGTPDVTPGVSPFVPDAFSGFNAGGASPVPTFVKPVSSIPRPLATWLPIKARCSVDA